MWLNNVFVCARLPLYSFFVTVSFYLSFFLQVGLPAKSGVSGCIFLVVPNVMGICLFSPPLDKIGNSIRGVQFARVSDLLPAAAVFFLSLFLSFSIARDHTGRPIAEAILLKHMWMLRGSDPGFCLLARFACRNWCTHLTFTTTTVCCRTTVNGIHAAEGIPPRLVKTIQDYKNIYFYKKDLYLARIRCIQ